jgi:hypothetical protein
MPNLFVLFPVFKPESNFESQDVIRIFNNYNNVGHLLLMRILLGNQLMTECVIPMMQEKQIIAARILMVAEQRGSDKSTCPSEIARMLFPNDWREHMRTIMEVAIDLSIDGKILITQKGKAIDVGKIKGPVRIKQSS